MSQLAHVIDWRRALLLLPVIAAVVAAIYFLAWRDSDDSTLRASLLDTPAETGADVGTDKGQVARDFVAYSPDGEAVRLSDLRGTPTILNFWATWCTSCAAELPDLRDLQAEVGKDQLHVVAMNVGETSGAARGFLDNIDAPDFLIGMDPTFVVADAYGVRGMPQSVFVDRDGYIRAVYVGRLTEEIMREYLAAAADQADAAEIEGPLRLVTTVGRYNTLTVTQLEPNVVEYRSKGLRCDDSYCASHVIDALAGEAGVLSIARQIEADPPTITVTLDPGTTTEESLTGALAEALDAEEDPLYTLPLEVVYD